MSNDVSPAAQAANRRLHEMKAQLAIARKAAGRPTDPEPGRQGGENAVVSHSLSSLPIPQQPLSTSNPLHACPATAPIPFTVLNHPTSVSQWQLATNAAPSTEKGGKEPCSHSESTLAHASIIHQLPKHLGWGSETLTAHLRKLRIRNYEIEIQNSPADRATDKGQTGRSAAEKGRGGEREPGSGNTEVLTNGALASSATPLPLPPFAKVYPDIALGMLREDRAAAGRVWLLLRALDAPGRGMVSVAEARAALTDKGSPLRLCGWRRLRQLLCEGEDVFWARERGKERPPAADRLRLFGPARVAAALAVRRLVGRPVGIPLSALLGSIGDARAHLYATFHSGRAREEWAISAAGQGGKGAGGRKRLAAPLLPFSPSPSGAPISRDTLAVLSGACASSQAAYERKTGICSRSNIALGERVAASAAIGPAEQERAWQRGRALFRLCDHRGHHGHPGATYLAWRLPNAFGPARGHQQRPKGRQKRINRQLADLFTKGMTGNGERIEKRFYTSAVAAVRKYELRTTNYELKTQSACRSADIARHWPVGGSGRGGCGIWGTVETAADYTYSRLASASAAEQASFFEE